MLGVPHEKYRPRAVGDAKDDRIVVRPAIGDRTGARRENVETHAGTFARSAERIGAKDRRTARSNGIEKRGVASAHRFLLALPRIPQSTDARSRETGGEAAEMIGMRMTQYGEGDRIAAPRA